MTDRRAYPANWPPVISDVEHPLPRLATSRKTHSQKIITLQEVFSTFPEQRIFTMDSFGKVKVLLP
jgi:hypothetical protein